MDESARQEDPYAKEVVADTSKLNDGMQSRVQSGPCLAVGGKESSWREAIAIWGIEVARELSVTYRGRSWWRCRAKPAWSSLPNPSNYLGTHDP